MLFVLLNSIIFIPFSYIIYAQNENDVQVNGRSIYTQSFETPTLIDPLLKAEVVVKGLHFPTGMAILDSGEILIIEKNDGNVKRIVNGTNLQKPLLDVNVANKNGRGLLGIGMAKHENGLTYVFLYYTESKTKDGEDVINGIQPLGNRLYRYELNDNHLINPKLLLDLPANSDTMAYSNYNSGGKIIIGPDENVYVSVGDIGSHLTKAQNVKDGFYPDGTGGILRVTQDGKPVEGILGDNFPLNLYFAYGIRNILGMDFDPLTGNLWDTEEGDDHSDEINLVESGFNSGWKVVQGMSHASRTNLDNLVRFPGLSYSEKGLLGIIEKFILEIQDKEGKYNDPKFVWTDVVGISALRFLESNKLGSKYQNDMFVGDMLNGNLYHFKLNKQRTAVIFTDRNSHLNDKIVNNKAEYEEVLFATGFGSITDLQVGTDGYLYVLTYDKATGTIFRIVPANTR
jgi:glucose/arabinose dehydrogenase